VTARWRGAEELKKTSEWKQGSRYQKIATNLANLPKKEFGEVVNEGNRTCCGEKRRKTVVRVSW